MRFPKWYPIDRLNDGELLGSLHAEYKRCGKPNCTRCAGGGRHGPYWYRYWRDENGKRKKAYVKAYEVDEVRAAIERRKARLTVERERRKKHMRRGVYAWKAQDPNTAKPGEPSPSFEQFWAEVLGDAWTEQGEG